MAIKALTPIMQVEDVARTVDFFTRALGFTQTGEHRHEGRLVWANVQRDGVHLMLGEGHTHDEAGGTLPIDHSQGHREVALYYYAEDVAALREEFLGRGVEVSELSVTFYGMREFMVTDPDGFELIFGQEAAGD
ncbi:MAG: VOC family protein [Armatimonadetes bacterium]|nr:VOC family protein [Armatimonadota bacterium]